MFIIQLATFCYWWCWQVCRMGKYHNVLYIAMKISWNWGVKDSAVVCALLSMNFTIECLFAGNCEL